MSHRKQIPASENRLDFWLVEKGKGKERGEKKKKKEQNGEKLRAGREASVSKRAVAVIVVFPRGKVSGRRKYETSVYILPEYKTSRPLARSA